METWVGEFYQIEIDRQPELSTNLEGTIDFRFHCIAKHRIVTYKSDSYGHFSTPTEPLHVAF